MTCGAPAHALLTVRRTAWVCLAAAIGLSGCGPATNPDAVRRFQMGTPDAVLLVTGGNHGRTEMCDCTGPMVGGLARRSGLVASYRQVYPDTFVLDSGDMLWIEPGDPRNRYVANGYRMMGYDAVVLGDHELYCSAEQLTQFFPQPDSPTLLGTTARPADPPSDLGIQPVAKATFARAKIAVLSDLRREWLLFMPDHRMQRLTFSEADDLAERVTSLKADGWVVVVVCHGGGDALNQTARVASQADLIVRGHTTRSSAAITKVAGRPVIKVGGPDFVGVVGFRVEKGVVTDIEFHLETVDERWPLHADQMGNFRRYVDELDARKHAAPTP